MILNRCSVFVLSLFILNFLFAIPSDAQVKKKKVNKVKYEWGNMGLGFPLQKLRSDILKKSYGVDYNRTLGPIFIQGGISGSLHNYLPSLFEIHVAPGYAIGFHKTVMVAMSIGPGYMSGDDLYANSYRGLGADGTFQLLFKPLPDIGLGAEMFFNYPFASNIKKPPASNGIRIVLTISTL